MTGTGILRVTVTARQRLALGIGSEVGYFTGTHSFVPGSVLRGALAAAWIAEHGPPGLGNNAASFRELFDGAIRYGPMYAAGAVLVPVSVWLCKYPNGPECDSQAVDAAFEAGGECPACCGPLEQGKGQILFPDGMALERITRTSINPATAKAADGELYAHGALPAGTTLTGYIHGRDPWLERSRRLRLGGRRTVSGSADYQAVEVEPAERAGLCYEWPGLGARTETSAGADDPVGASLVIRLASPAVFVDAAGRPSLAPDPNLDLDGATVGRGWARPVTWSGWHAASRLPKPEELCAAPGSTYRISGPASTLRRLAERLPRDGAGLRRVEGFGDIRVARRPWRPPARIGPAELPATADAQVQTWLQDLRDLALDPAQLRWVADALRELQLARERPTGDLLGRAAAAGFSGRQRERLGGLFTEPDPQQLRDLTMLLLSEMAGDLEGEGG